MPVLKGHQWRFWLMWQWEYQVTSPWSERHDAMRDEQRTSLPLVMTQRVSELHNQLVEMPDPVIRTDSCVPEIHLMLQNCHSDFLVLQSYLEMSINQICERENYLHRFFSDSWSFTPNRYVPVNDTGSSQSKHGTLLAVSSLKKHFSPPRTAEGLECTSISRLKVTIMTKKVGKCWTVWQLIDSRALTGTNLLWTSLAFTHVRKSSFGLKPVLLNLGPSKASWKAWKNTK